ncbi:MAG: 5'/3'-nucleotidase SurE [Firmicutes bacterium]|nr:5'/3'-nucleotidase SurE [Bacillota bacterium]
MRILVTNDDGIESVGIHVLAKALSQKHEVVLVAPDGERSACSQSLSSMYSVTYKEDSRFGFTAYSMSGTPADCVKLATLHLMRQPPDLVVSGINNGMNLGTDVIYSGTVAAAFEGLYMGVRSIAVSTGYHASEEKLEEVAAFVVDNLDKMLALDLPGTSALNINYPAKQPVKGVKITGLGDHRYFDGFVPHGEGHRLTGTPQPLPEDGRDCDIHWFGEGYVTLTPVQNDRNDYVTLKRIKGEFVGANNVRPHN